MAWGTEKLKKPKKLPKSLKISKLDSELMTGKGLTTPVTTASIIPKDWKKKDEEDTETDETTAARDFKNEGPVTSTQGDTSGGGMPGGYTPFGYNNVFWTHPEALAQDFLAGRNINSPQFTEEFTPTVDALNLLTAFLGSDATGELLDASGQANQMNDYMSQIMTPGGQALDPSAIMMALANADPNSAAGFALAAMTPEQVSSMALQLVSAAGGNPFQMRGLQAGFEQGLRDYYVDQSKLDMGGTAAADPYWTGLRSGPLGRFFGG